MNPTESQLNQHYYKAVVTWHRKETTKKFYFQDFFFLISEQKSESLKEIDNGLVNEDRKWCFLNKLLLQKNKKYIRNPKY